MSETRRARFERIFEGHYGRVLRYLERRVSADDAHDALAETFTVAWRRLEELPDDPAPWLYGTARRVLANQRRAALRRDALAERIAAESTPAFVEEPQGGRVITALARLAEPDREALLLIAWEGLNRTEAARAMGCSIPAFAARLHRARRRLQRLMEEEDRVLPRRSRKMEETS